MEISKWFKKYENDPKEVSKIADFCRFKLGWNYSQTVSIWIKGTGKTQEDYDEIIYEAEYNNPRY